MASTTTGRRALIFHGYGATPSDHWFGWLAQRLEADGIPVTVPALPDPLEPDPVVWEDAARTALGTPDAGTIVVAHSLGCLTMLRALGSLTDPWRLGTLVLVAGFLDPLPALPELDGFIADGTPVEGRAVAGLAEHIDRLVVLRSDRDEIVPTDHTDRLAALLGTEARVVDGAGHFLADDGVTEAPAIHDAVLFPVSEPHRTGRGLDRPGTPRPTMGPMQPLGPAPWPPAPIITDRLTLRPSEARDRDGIIELFASPEVCTYTGGPRPREELEASVPEIPGRREGFFVVERDGEFLGMVTFDRRDAAHPGHVRPEGNEAQLGYLFLPRAWGRGYATEACTAALAWFAAAFPGEPVVVPTQTANPASLRLAQRLGFREVERFEEYGAEQWFGVWAGPATPSSTA